MTELKIYYPTGLIGVVDYSPSLHFNVVQPLKGPGLLVTGDPGSYSIQQLGVTDKGTIEVLLVLGAPGANRSVAFFVDQWPNPTKFVGIALDDSNRPMAYLSIDGVGTILGVGLPSGSANSQGTQIKVRFSYNLDVPIHQNSTAILQVGDRNPEPWAVEPGVDPGLFQPNFLVLGSQVIPNYLAFNGSIVWAQTCDTVDEIQPPTPGPEETLTNGALDQPLDFPL
jgi:hypothetical protein